MRRVLALFLLLAACNRQGPHKPSSPAATGDVSFDAVKAVFTKNCAGCHPSRAAPDWLNYDQAKAYANNGRLVQRVVHDRSMPPPQTPESASMTESERQLIDRWAKAGAPETARGEPRPGPAQEPPVAQSCFQCHGAEGAGSESEPKIPRLAGQNEEYLVQQIYRFKWRERVDPTNRMNDVALMMGEEQIRSAANYFAKKPWPRPSRPVTAESARLNERGKLLARISCNVCHASDAAENRPLTPWLPELRGQSQPYLINQMLHFRADERRSPLMHQFARELSNEDIEALAVHYAFGGD